MAGHGFTRAPRRLLLAAGMAALVAFPAAAQDLGTTSTGTVNITVVIQPLGGAVAAQQQFGAVGLWSFTGSNPGLMVSAPQTVDAGAQADISVFAQSTSILTVRSLGGTVLASPKDSAFVGGLSRRQFSIPVPSRVEELGGRNSQLFVVGTI